MRIGSSATILAAQSRWEEAIAELRTAVDLRPRFGENLSHLGLALVGSGRYSDAVAVYRRLTELQPENSRAFQRLGTAYHEIGNDEQLWPTTGALSLSAPTPGPTRTSGASSSLGDG
jgi:Flp pilus assembly protein TadD